MKTLFFTALFAMTAADAAWCHPLEKRFGPDGERGYRSEREFDGDRREFKNRDRANFLGTRQHETDLPEPPRVDLQAPAAIGMQR